MTHTYQVTAQLPGGIELIVLVCVGILTLIGLVGLAIWVVYKLTKRGPPPAYGPPPVATCQVCGQPLAWIAAHNRWYCSRCGQYR